MSGVQLTGPRCPEPLARIVRVPDVEITNLRSFGRADADDAAGRRFPGPAGADGKSEFFYSHSERLLNGSVDSSVDGQR